MPQNIGQMSSVEFRKLMLNFCEKELEENDCHLLVQLLEVRPSSRIYSKAEEWLLKYPSHENATRVAGSWLASSGSIKATQVAINYLNQDSQRLRPILGATNSPCVNSSRLYRVIEQRMQLSPFSENWSGLQSLNSRKSLNDRLLVRWLSWNLENEKIAVGLSSVALFSSSYEVLRLIVDWTRTAGTRSRPFDIVLVFQHLLLGKSDAHQKIQSDLTILVREWMFAHLDNEDCGRLLGTFLSRNSEVEDINWAVDWYLKFGDTKTSIFVLTAILRESKKKHMRINPYILEQSVLRLKTEPHLIEIPVFLHALLEIHPTPEVVNAVRASCSENSQIYLLASVLKYVSDPELISLAKLKLVRWGSSPAAGELLIAVMNLDLNDPEIMTIGKKWLRHNHSHSYAKELKKLLRERANL